MAKVFTNFIWRNRPSKDSPLNAVNLNKLNNAIDAIDTKTQNLPADGTFNNVLTDWFLLTMQNNFIGYQGIEGNTLRVRRRGNTVELWGIIGVSQIVPVEVALLMASGIPANMRPANQIVAVCQGSDMNRFTITINTSGNIGYGRYGTTTNSQTPLTAWLPISVTWTV